MLLKLLFEYVMLQAQVGLQDFLYLYNIRPFSVLHGRQ